MAAPDAGSTRTATTPTRNEELQELLDRASRALAKLSTLSNGATTRRPDATTTTVRARSSTDPKARALAASDRTRPTYTHGSRVPAGVRLTADASAKWAAIPSRELDPHGWYAAHIMDAWQAQDYERVGALCLFAERDYNRQVRRNRHAHDDADTRDARIVSAYRGVPAWDVAVLEGCNPESVRRTRRKAGMEPELGEEPERDPLRLRIVNLASSGMSQRGIATEVGKSVGFVNGVLKACS